MHHGRRSKSCFCVSLSDLFDLWVFVALCKLGCTPLCDCFCWWNWSILTYSLFWSILVDFFCWCVSRTKDFSAWLVQWDLWLFALCQMAFWTFVSRWLNWFLKLKLLESALFKCPDDLSWRLVVSNPSDPIHFLILSVWALHMILL